MRRHDDTIDLGSRRKGAGTAIATCPHGRAALALALEDGLILEEVEEVLAGRRLVAAFPVGWREGPDEYAVRAVAEMMVAYLAHDPSPVADHGTRRGPDPVAHERVAA